MVTGAEAVRRATVWAGMISVCWGAGCAHRPVPEVLLPARPPAAPRAALYSDCGVNAKSVMAAHHMLGWMGLAVERVDASRINTDGLAGFDLLCIPGGNMYQYSKSMTKEGKANVRRFVAEGGGYLGICGGAYYAASKVVWCGLKIPMEPLKLYDGKARGPLFSLGPFKPSMCQVRLLAPGLGGMELPEGHPWMLYWAGPALLAKNGAAVTEVARYDKVDLPAALAFAYGQGHVFLIGPHPEFEEDNERDGLSFAKDLDDHGSDWDFMKTVVSWCLGGAPRTGVRE